MRLLKQLLAPSLLLSLNLLPAAQACLPSAPIASNSTGNGTTQYPYVLPGTDDPADWATMGYVLNHFALNVKNLTASLDFYSQIFGMRLIFTFYATEKVSITYMAHSHGGKNGTQYQTTSELNRDKNNMEGLIELLHYADSGVDLSPSTKVSNTFSHYGLVVPDINATQSRLEELGVPILKSTGQGPETMTEEAKVEVGRGYGYGDIWKDDPVEAAKIFGILLEQVPGAIDFIMIVDPDGNLIEIQPQEMPQIPL